VKKRFGYALGLALVTSIVTGAGANAMSANAWHDLLEVLPDLKQMFDAAPGLVASDLPSLVSADGDLEERLGRAKKFHSAHEFKEAEPKIDGHRLFSKDLNVSAAMRDEYARFVDDEAHDIERLKARRDAQASRLAEYQRLFDRNADFANKAPDLIGRAGKVSYEMAEELASVLLTAEQAKPLAQALVDEYRRILSEYDSKIRQEEIAHAAHVMTLGTVDAIRPKPESAGFSTGAPLPAASMKAGIAAGSGRATLGDRIRDAIYGATAEVDAHASQSQARLSSEQRQMGSLRPMPSRQGLSPPVPQAPSDFEGTITMYPNSN
jgi:hypothetical protein